MASAAIQKWKPIHENVVQLHISGMKNKRIAKLCGLTKERVSQILCDPQARVIIRQRNLRVREELAKEMDGRLLILSERSVERLEETMDVAEQTGTDAKKHQDNVALKILQGRGFLTRTVDESRTRERQPIEASLLERLTSAMEKANKAREMHEDDEEVPLAEIVG